MQKSHSNVHVAERLSLCVLERNSLLISTPPHVFQGYPPSLQSDYQPLGGGMLNGGAVMSSSMDYHQLGRHTPNHHPSLDWGTDYHGNG